MDDSNSKISGCLSVALIFLGSTLMICLGFGTNDMNLVIGGFAILFLMIVIICLFRSTRSEEPRKEEKSSRSNSEPDIDYSRYTTRTYTYWDDESDETYEEERRQQAFWSGAYRYLQEFARQYDIDAIHEFAINVWNDKNDVLYAAELHQFLDHTVEALYQFRHVEACREYILEIGSLALTLFEEAKKHFPYGRVCARYPNRMAIILEKDDRIEEALALSEECLRRGIQDLHADKTFEARAIRLRRKLK